MGFWGRIKRIFSRKEVRFIAKSALAFGFMGLDHRVKFKLAWGLSMARTIAIAEKLHDDVRFVERLARYLGVQLCDPEE